MRVLLFTFLISLIYEAAFSLEIQKNEQRIFIAAANDKFTYGISQNKDDQLTATAEFHFILPYFFINIHDNSITNRGYKTNIENPSTFTNGRYDELSIKTGTNINLYDNQNFKLTFTPQAGFCLLGNFGMGIAQNTAHRINSIDEVKIDYEKFTKPFAPVLNAVISASYTPFDFLKCTLNLTTNNALFYTTDQSVTFNATVGNKTIFNIFTGYTWNQTHTASTTLQCYKNVTEGFNYGFNLDTGLFKFDFITFQKSRNGLGTIYMDFLNFKNHNWKQTDVSFYTGFSYLINTKFLETQIESKITENFSVYLNNKYVSGFKTNKVNVSPYRYERDYEIITAGIKYEQPLPFLHNWITPYVEVGTGVASFGLQKLAYHLPQENFDIYKYDTKAFWQMEANIGLDIIPQGLLNFGSACYRLTIYAGTIFIPEYKKAGAQIKYDTYRTTGWSLKPFEFEFGFSIHMGLDF